MTRPRLLACLLALALAVPSAAFAQGAGDDQYQDPFGDQQAQGGGSDGGGLSNTPPGGSSGSGSSGGSSGSGSSSGSSGSGSSSGSSSGSGSSGSSSGTSTTTTTPQAARATGSTLPRTGSDPRVLAVFGAALLLAGVGLRLRTIDPDDF